jgi:hypothetical protein
MSLAQSRENASSASGRFVKKQISRSSAATYFVRNG